MRLQKVGDTADRITWPIAADDRPGQGIRTTRPTAWRLSTYRCAAAGCAVVAVTVAAGDDDLLDHAGAVSPPGQ
jgi:hypothetical protein